ncbi:MAG: hypothetical protein ACKO2K_06720, partial [Alphaproteobacteria bacterium]
GWLAVDPRVWRGFFDPKLLRSDPGYDTRAGAEILARLASPGLRSTGDGSEASATTAEAALREAAEIHALHDGGPAELRRLREGRASAAEVAASRGFREKLARVRAGARPTVPECFGTEAALSPLPAPEGSPSAEVPPASPDEDAAPRADDAPGEDSRFSAPSAPRAARDAPRADPSPDPAGP